jgi:hypothetical protein
VTLKYIISNKDVAMAGVREINVYISPSNSKSGIFYYTVSSIPFSSQLIREKLMPQLLPFASEFYAEIDENGHFGMHFRNFPPDTKSVKVEIAGHTYTVHYSAWVDPNPVIFRLRIYAARFYAKLKPD